VQIKDAIISHGCFLRECAIEHSIVGVRSRLNSGCELKVHLLNETVTEFTHTMTVQSCFEHLQTDTNGACRTP